MTAGNVSDMDAAKTWIYHTHLPLSSTERSTISTASRWAPKIRVTNLVSDQMWVLNNRQRRVSAENDDITVKQTFCYGLISVFMCMFTRSLNSPVITHPATLISHSSVHSPHMCFPAHLHTWRRCYLIIIFIKLSAPFIY